MTQTATEADRKQTAKTGIVAVLAASGFLAGGAQAGPPQGEDRFFVEFHRHGRDSARTVREAGGRPVHDFPRYGLVAAWLSPKARERLSKNPSVVSIENDPKRYPYAESVPYGIPMVQADLLGDGTAATRKVCIIDSGYHEAHDDLQDSNVSASPDSGTGNPFVDECGHGTHVAGTIAALANDEGVVGVLPSGNIGLHIVKVFGDTCSWTYSSDLITALDECTQAGANVVSMSLGGSFKSRWEDRAFTDAYNRNVLSVAAAGNGGNTQRSYPASYNSVISVAAVDSAGIVASFSQQNDQVELAAPGVEVLSTVPWLEINTLTTNGEAYSGHHIENSGRANLGAFLADGGKCTGTSSAWQGNIVLCERGDVSFNTKVQNVQTSMGAGAVIYNDVDGGFIGTLGTGNTSDIAAISLSRAGGLAVLPFAQAGAGADLVSQLFADASGYEAWNGTSMATPHVSGVAALVWSHDPNRTNQEIRDALANTALDLGPAGRDNAYGHGLVQAKAALDYLGGGGSSDPDPGCIPTEDMETSCSDTVDNDCDGLIDGSDPDCQTTSEPDTCELQPLGASCSADSECCSGKCRGKPGTMTCR